MTTENPASALTGAAYDLVTAGYRSMPDMEDKEKDEALASDAASLREAAAARVELPNDLVVRRYLGPDGQPASANEAVSLARAGRDYAGATAAEKLVAENETSRALAARVDALRAEVLANDPDAAEFYGFAPPETAAAEADIDKAGPTGLAHEEQGVSRDPAGLDPELEKALQNPQVRHAIEEQLVEAEKTRQVYLDGLAAATQIAQLSFLSQFPELAAVAPEHLPAALEQMSRQEPAKFARIQSIVAGTEQLFAQQRAESNQHAELTRLNFQNYARSEDARLETMLAAEPRATQAAVTAEILASARESGVEPGELNHLFNTEPLMRNAVFQRMMYDAGKYRLLMKAKQAAAAKPLPPVQRPGTARNAAEREHAELRTLNARLSSTGDIRDAVALYHARKSGR